LGHGLHPVTRKKEVISKGIALNRKIVELKSLVKNYDVNTNELNKEAELAMSQLKKLSTTKESLEKNIQEYKWDVKKLNSDLTWLEKLDWMILL
jgi:chromosome segregation ATPase